jgi:hypothetical protein
VSLSVCSSKRAAAVSWSALLQPQPSTVRFLVVVVSEFDSGHFFLIAGVEWIIIDVDVDVDVDVDLNDGVSTKSV